MVYIVAASSLHRTLNDLESEEKKVFSISVTTQSQQKQQGEKFESGTRQGSPAFNRRHCGVARHHFYFN